jgi:hypothetical protein
MRFTLPFALLLLFATAAADDDLPPFFEYRFPDVDPIKIYSGGVTFTHKKHAVQYKIDCVRCHHDLEPGETDVDTNCRDCHEEEGFPRFEEAARLSDDEKMAYHLIALHTLCLDCHIETPRKDGQRRPPISCTRCHLKTHREG